MVFSLKAFDLEWGYISVSLLNGTERGLSVEAKQKNVSESSSA